MQCNILGKKAIFIVICRLGNNARLNISKNMLSRHLRSSNGSQFAASSSSLYGNLLVGIPVAIYIAICCAVGQWNFKLRIFLLPRRGIPKAVYMAICFAVSYAAILAQCDCAILNFPPFWTGIPTRSLIFHNLFCTAIDCHSSRMCNNKLRVFLLQRQGINYRIFFSLLS